MPGMSSLSYALPQHALSLAELAEKKLIRTTPDVLASFGFTQAWLTQTRDELFTLQTDVVRNLMSSIEQPTRELEAVIVYHGVEGVARASTDSELGPFRYATSRLQYEIGLEGVPFYTMSQQGCNGLLAAVWLGARLLATSEKRYLAIVSADRLATGARREIIHNIMSDSAAGVVLDSQEIRRRVLMHHQIDHPYYWDTPERETEVLAAYFPMAERTIRETLERAGLSWHDLRWIVPHNVSIRSWEILAKLIGFPLEQVWLNNVPRVGHTVSADHIINLHDMESAGVLEKGDRVLLFSFGFGASWAGQILEY